MKKITINLLTRFRLGSSEPYQVSDTRKIRRFCCVTTELLSVHPSFTKRNRRDCGGAKYNGAHSQDLTEKVQRGCNVL